MLTEQCIFLDHIAREREKQSDLHYKLNITVIMSSKLTESKKRKVSSYAGKLIGESTNIQSLICG